MTGLATGEIEDVTRADAVTLDCFDTLVTADRPDEPWTAVANQLADRGVPVPDDWEAAYRTGHVDLDRREELALDRHVVEALAARGIDCDHAVARDAVFAAFDRSTRPRDGAAELCRALPDAGVPVGVVSNCAVPGLVESALERAGLAQAFDVVVTSVGCGWRKPDPRPFEAAATALDVPAADLVHVGDDAAADGGAENAGATAVLTETASLSELVEALEGSSCP